MPDPSGQSPMVHIALAHPAHRTGGNLTTALRLKGHLAGLGHRVTLLTHEQSLPAGIDQLVALHARRCLGVLEACATEHPGVPRIVIATGTDLNVDLPGPEPRASKARRGFELANAIVVLHDLAKASLPPSLAHKALTILQSHPDLRRAESRPAHPRGASTPLNVVLLADVRPVKNTLLIVRALEFIPRSINIRVLHAGNRLNAELSAKADAAHTSNPRYEFLGPLPHPQAMERLASAHLALNTSHSEGGANAVSEAITLGVPLVLSDIPGNRGLCGAKHPGLFQANSPHALAELLTRAAQEPDYLEELYSAGEARYPRFTPTAEASAWASLVDKLRR